jgi:hypothetical protein
MTQQTPVGQGPLVIEASPSHLDKPHSVEPLWTSDQPSARRRDLYLTTHNTHKRQTSMPQAGFEPVHPTSERSQTHALDRATSGVGACNIYYTIRLMMTLKL